MRKFLILILIVVGFTSNAQVAFERKLLTDMLNVMHSLKNIETDIKVVERNDGKMITATPHIKIQFDPKKIYVKLKEDGVELLWSEDVNNGKALVNPNGFPYINLSLDIDGYFLRDKKHHTLREAGFIYFAGIMEKSLNLYGEKFYDCLSYKGEIKWNNRDCYNVVVNYNDFKYVDYTLPKDEDLVSLARRLNVAEHMVKEKNDLSGYGVIKKGKTIKVPTYYGKKIVLYVDKELMLPIYQEIEDDLGVYEHYEYSNVKINKVMAADEFSEKNKKYGF